jgi:hypothetical protein
MKHLSELIAVIGSIDPVASVTTEVFTDVIDMSKFDQVMAVFMGGNVQSNDTMICKAYTCDSGGSNAAALKTASTVGAGTDNTQVVIEVDNNDLAGGGTNANRYIKFGYASGGSGGPGAVLVLGKAKYGPSSDEDLATVAEIETDLD